MNKKEKLGDLLAHWFASFGAPQVPMDDTGICVFCYQDQNVITVEMPQDRELGFAYTAITQVPPENQREFFKTALALNSFGLATRGATLALDTEKDLLFIYRFLRVDALDETSFKNIMDNFLASIKETRINLNQFHDHSLSEHKNGESNDLSQGNTMHA